MFSTRGCSPSTNASMFTGKLSCSCVCLKRLLSTTWGIASFDSSITSRTSFLLSFRSALCVAGIPVTTLFFTRVAIFSSTLSPDTMYGRSLTTMRWRSPRTSSTVQCARTLIEPRPVSNASYTPWRPMMIPPLGKSGPFTCSSSCSAVISGVLIIAIVASITSPRLCGGMFVAMPTAMPVEPFTSRFGKRAGRTDGSRSSPS